MRVGIDVSAVVYGTGVADYTLDLLQSLRHLEGGRKDSFQVIPFGYSLRRRDDLKRLVLKGSSLPFPPTLMHYLWNRLHIVHVESLIGKIDIYHSSDWAQGPSRAKKVTTVHDLSPFLYPQEVDSKIVAVYRARMQWVVKECDRIICVSKNTASDLKRLFAVFDDRIQVIYEALPERFKLQPQLTRSANYIVTIGARQPRKNIARLVNAFLQFKNKYNLPPKLIVIGELPSNQITNNQVTYTGYVSDQQLVDYLAGASVFVYPSLYEGFGLPVLGAFHHGVPVACSNTSSLPEVAGDAAVYFDPFNEEAMARAITEAISRRQELVTAGKAQLAKFSWAKAASETLAVYKSLV